MILVVSEYEKLEVPNNYASSGLGSKEVNPSYLGLNYDLYLAFWDFTMMWKVPKRLDLLWLQQISLRLGDSLIYFRVG